MKKSKMLRICVGASAGGHLNQLLKLLEVSDSWPGRPDLYVTTMTELAEKLERYGPVYVVGECNRRHPLKILAVFARGLRLVIRERPDVIITTGSLPLALLCLCGKMFGAKVVWIDSIANVERLSVSGRMTRYFADLFLIQWPDLEKRYENVEFAGAIV